MNLEAVKVLIATYIQENSVPEDFVKPVQTDKIDYASVFQDKILQGVINKCDADSNGELDSSEIHKLSQKLTSYEEFLNVSFDGFLETVDSDVNWEEFTTEENLTQDEANLQDYEEKTEFANFVISSDDKITQEQYGLSVDLDLKIDENLEKINELLENKDNLTDEQKAELSQLLSTRKDLLSQRANLESTFLTDSDDKTALAIKDMQAARALLNSDQLESQEALDALQKELGISLDDVVDPNADNVVEAPVAPQTVYNQTSGGGGGGGSTYVPAKSTQEVQQEKAKTKEELQQELTVTEAELTQNQDSLKGVVDGTSSELLDEKTAMDTTFENYQKILEEVAPELAQQLDEAKVELDSAKEAYDENQMNIVNYTASLMVMQTTMTGYNGEIAACESALASLNATDTSNFTSEQLADYNKRKSDLTQKRDTIKDLQSKLETQISATDKLLGDCNNADEALSQAVVDSQAKYDEIEAQIQLLDNETLNAAKSDYDTAKEVFETKQATLSEAYTVNIANATTKIQDLKTQISELEKQETESQGKMGINGNPVEFNGQTYDSVVPAEKINELLKLISSTNATTRDGHSDMCLAFSVWYGQYLNGKASASEFNQFLKSGNIPYGNGRSKMNDFDNNDKNNILSKVANEINSGRPAILQVGANKNKSRHYVLVVGLREGASNPPKEDDLLIVDTYDGVLEGMGQYGTRDMITGAQCRKKYSGYQMYTLTA